MTKRIYGKKSKAISIGQTLETNDLYLPYKSNRVPKSKNRPVIIVDKNRNNEFVVIPGSTEDTPNTTYYGKHKIKYYRHNIEIEDNDGKPIMVGTKFRKTSNCSKLPESEAIRIRNHVVNHTKFSSDNKTKYNKFWNRNKKSRD